jgi:hypothetical protein
MGEHVHGGVVRGMERRTGTHRLDAGLLGGVDEVVELALQRGERAVDRQGPRHVCGVEVVPLDPHVEQDELAGVDRAGVVDPVQGRGVRAATDDRVVADVVAHGPGPAEERALDPPLAVLEDAVPLGDGVGEAERGDVAGGLELGDLPVVLDQPHLGDHPGEVGVAGLVGRHDPVDVAGDAAVDPGLAGAAEVGGEAVDVAHLEPQGVRDLLQGRAAAHPELAVLAVAEELVGGALRSRPGVEHALAVLDDQDGVAGLVAAEVGVGGVGPEAVVGVVGPHLEASGRQHQALPWEGLGEPLPASRGVRRDRVRRQVELAVTPALAHELRVGLRDGRVVRLGLQGRLRRLVRALGRYGVDGVGGLFAHVGSLRPARPGARRGNALLG